MPFKVKGENIKNCPSAVKKLDNPYKILVQRPGSKNPIEIIVDKDSLTEAIPSD